DGIRGQLQALPARGALLDGAGQLLGYWLMEATEIDRFPLPVKVARIEFFASEPAPDELVDCTVRIRDFEPDLIRADLELACGGRLYARISGWEDRRFET